MTSSRSDEAPYLRIAAAIRQQITDGNLRTGDRVPSTRQICHEWGVAMATATKALSSLRNDGLVHAVAGVGTVVSPRAAASARPRPRPVERSLTRARLVRAGIELADREGLDAVSMRRLSTDLEVGTMSLYRHVTNKDELVHLMADAVFAESELPDPGPSGWRAKLELVARAEWELYVRHPWLPHVISFTRPLLVPNAMAHTEWTLAAIDGIGLTPDLMWQEAMALAAYVCSIASAVTTETEAEQESGLTKTEWWTATQTRIDALLRSGRFPVMARLARQTDPVEAGLQVLFEYGLARHLDGLAALINEQRAPRSP